jgi:hypothetical protein
MEGEVIGISRYFVSDCPVHGSVTVKAIRGNHFTLGEKELGERYPQAVRRRIRGIL